MFSEAIKMGSKLENFSGYVQSCISIADSLEEHMCK
jgi:hypothetical protein